MLRVDYPVIPFPRENDLTIMYIATSLGYRGERLRSINRCRLFCNAIFLSDLAAANGKRLDPRYISNAATHALSSSYNFPREQPSDDDWAEWRAFWQSYCLSDGTLPRSLGKWIHLSHRRWEWFYDEASDLLQQRSPDDTIWCFRRCLDAESLGSVTRSQDCYARVGCLQSGHGIKGLPATVEISADGLVTIRSTGPPLLLAEPVGEESFWTFLKAWGGEWMWDDRHMPDGFDAVVDAIFSGTAIYVTDGSYNRPLREDLDGAGWLIYCTSRKRIIFTSSFCESSKYAGSYRGELLGLLAIHVFLLAITEFYDLRNSSLGTIACDNLGGLNKSKERRRKVPSNHKHADILRSLRRVHARLRGRLIYRHVYGHQDRRKTWNQMSLLERLNCKCDSLAKKAIHLGIQNPPLAIPSRQRLPLESAAVYYKDRKLSGECGSEIRFQAGRVAARRFYIGELGWYSATFDSVDWEARDKSISSKPDMFRIWLFKQSSSFCASGKNMGRWFGSAVTCCPNCLQPDEDAAHLLHCPDPGRFALLRDELRGLEDWMQKSYTHPSLAHAVSHYVFHRGAVKFQDIPGLPFELRRLAEEQDLIGWENFMEGKISWRFREIQLDYLLGTPSMMTAFDWTAKFISSLLHITHGQWIYRNISRHHHIYGLLKSTERRELLREIDKFMRVDPEEVPEESRFLLEIDFQQFRHERTEKQSYWVHAIRAAVKAGRRVARYKHRRTSHVSSTSSPSNGAPAPPHRYGAMDMQEIQGVAVKELTESRKRQGVEAGSVADRSNKRRKPD